MKLRNRTWLLRKCKGNFNLRLNEGPTLFSVANKCFPSSSQDLVTHVLKQVRRPRRDKNELVDRDLDWLAANLFPALYLNVYPCKPGCWCVKELREKKEQPCDVITLYGIGNQEVHWCGQKNRVGAKCMLSLNRSSEIYAWLCFGCRHKVQYQHDRSSQHYDRTTKGLEIQTCSYYLSEVGFGFTCRLWYSIPWL